jgi:hypothetical protein
MMLNHFITIKVICQSLFFTVATFTIPLIALGLIGLVIKHIGA